MEQLSKQERNAIRFGIDLGEPWSVEELAEAKRGFTLEEYEASRNNGSTPTPTRSI